MASKNKVISSLQGTALRVFLYALQKGETVGTREVQRKVGLKSSSHALYHLQRLEQLGLLTKLPNSRYCIHENYKHLRSLKLGILTQVYVFNGVLIPSLAILSGYFTLSTIFFIIFYFTLGSFVSAIYACFTFITAAIFTIIRALQIVRTFRSDEESQSISKLD